MSTLADYVKRELKHLYEIRKIGARNGVLFHMLEEIAVFTSFVTVASIVG